MSSSTDPGTGSVQIGAMYMGGGDFTLKEFACAAEDVGFDSVWVGDHLAHYVDGITGLGILAGCTDRVTIGTNVIVLPFRSPAVVAKAGLTAAAVAKRTVVLGVGPGGDVPVEFDMAGADRSSRGRYTDEALEVISGLWSGEPFGFQGEWSRFDDVVMEPATGPRPRIWIGGRSDAALRRAVHCATGYNPYLVSPEQVAERFQKLARYATDTDSALTDFTFAATTFHVAATDVDEAVRRGHPRCGFRGVSEAHYRRSYVLGDEHSVLAGVQRYLDVGVRHLVVGCAPGADDQLHSFIDTFRGLIPELQTANPAR